MLHLRSKPGGSIEPLLAHLFKDAFDIRATVDLQVSLLEQLCPGKSTLAKFNSDRKFKADFLQFDTSAKLLTEIVQSISDDSVQTAVNTTAKLRNTTSHNLVWGDVFNEPENF